MDSTGAKISWHEYYDLNRNFLYREEYRYLKSKDVLFVNDGSNWTYHEGKCLDRRK